MKELAPLADRLRERVLRAIHAEIDRLQGELPSDEAHARHHQQLGTLREHADEIAAGMVANMSYAAELLVLPDPPELRGAVLERVAEQWPKYEPTHEWLRSLQRTVARQRFNAQQKHLGIELRFVGAQVFPDAKPARVAEWAIERASQSVQVIEGDGRVILFGVASEPVPIAEWVGDGLTIKATGHTRPVVCVDSGVALLCWAEEQVLRDRHLPATYIDAGRIHERFLTTLHRQAVDEKPSFERLTLRIPGESVQLSLPIAGDSPHEALIAFLQHRKTLGAEAVRHWLTYLTMLSKAGRTGTAPWTIDDHLAVAGYGRTARKKPELRARVRRMMELFSTIELEAELANGRRWASVPLIQVLWKEGTVENGKRVLDGALLQINPLLYGGVRNIESGKLGRNFFPTPPALAQIDHARRPYAQALGALLAIRWRVAWRNDGRGAVVRLSGRSLLEMAGIPYAKHDPGRTWKRLRESLDVLRKINHLGRYAWTGEAWTLDGVCELEAAGWLWDRTVAGVAPVERIAAQSIVTGEDLRTWRKERGLTQAQAGALIGMSVPTIQRAERARDRVLPRKVRQAVEAHTTHHFGTHRADEGIIPEPTVREGVAE